MLEQDNSSELSEARENIEKFAQSFDSRPFGLDTFREVILTMAHYYGPENVLNAWQDFLREMLQDQESWMGEQVLELVDEYIVENIGIEKNFGKGFLNRPRPEPYFRQLELTVYGRLVNIVKLSPGSESQSDRSDVIFNLASHLEQALQLAYKERGVSIALLQLFFPNMISVAEDVLHLNREVFTGYIQAERSY